MPKDYGELNFDKIFDKLDKMADKITKSGENVEGVAEKAGEQIGESFVGGIEQGLEDAASRIAASSLKINKAFKDLAKKITNQNISLGGINIDFSDINIDSDEFQKKIDKVFEQFKIDNAIEFDLKAAEKQFKNMLSLHTKYAIKLSKLQEQRPKLTSQASIKANAQEQLAVIDGLKEIQKILNQTSGMSIELPHVYFGDVKELRTSINLIEQLEKGEEKIGKQRDTNAEKIRKENKELKERNRILEEKVGPLEESPALKSKRSRVKSNMAKNAIPDYSMLPKEGKMILYHNTSSKNVGSIIKNGLRADAGKEQGRGKDGDLVWATTVPNQKGYGGNTIAFQIDVKLLADNPGWRANDTEYHIPIDIPAEDILFVDRPIDEQYRESDIASLVGRFGADKVKKVLGKHKINDGVSTERISELADVAAEVKIFREQYESLAKEFGYSEQLYERFNAVMTQVQQGAMTSTDAVAKLREEMSKQPAAPKVNSAIPSTGDIVAEFKELVKSGDVDDIGDIEAENGALKDKLELLKEISDQYGADGLNKDAKAYYKLWLKEMDGQEFSDSQQERYNETSDSLENAAKSLVSFGETYDKIIVKFGKGKPLEILPNVKGLEDLAKIADEYGEAYNGKEISDVVFVRTQQSAEAAAKANEKLSLTYEQLKDKVEAYYKIKREAVRLFNKGEDISHIAPNLREMEEDIAQYFDKNNANLHETPDGIKMMLQSASFDDKPEDALQRFAQILEIKIPEAQENTIRLAKEQEEAEKRAAELARQRAEEEARIAAEKEKQLAAEKHYYQINEDAAKRAKEANSYSDYVPGSATEEYRRQVDAARELVEKQKSRVDPMYHEKIDQLFDAYARKLAENMNKSFEIDARMPSILISGGGNFNVGKKQKQNVARDKNMEEWHEIQGLLDKIRSTGMGGISADDDQAVVKLEAKLKTLMEAQQLMKDVNAYFRKHGTLDGFEGLSKEEIEKLKADMASPWHLDKSKPFQSFSLQNNNAEINRVKKRIEELKKHEAQEYPEWEFDGGHVKANKEANRIQIFFDGKPADDVREQMKANAFKWSPKEGAWQRQLNDNAYRAMDNIDAIRPDTGEKPYEMLRKAKAEQKKLVEETAAAEAKADEQAITAEQAQLELAKQRADEEARIASKKEANHDLSGAQRQIKSQEELQKAIEDTNRVIKIQKQWLDYLDPVLDEDTFKTSGKREATSQLKSRTAALLDFRRHPEDYANLSDYETKVELAQSQAYKEAERQGVALSVLSRYHTDAVLVHDQNIKKLQEERAWHAKILEDAEKELALLQQQLQVETSIESTRKHKFSGTINGKSGKFTIKRPEPKTYETDSGQLSILPAVEAEANAKNKLAEANEKVVKSQKKVNEAQGTQLTIDDIAPSYELVEMSLEEADEWLNGPKEAMEFDKVCEAADKAAGSKKKFVKANKEVAASVTPSVDKLETEADAMEDVGEAAKKVSKTVSKEFNSVAKDAKFSTRDYEKLYDEMESFAAQRRAENGYDLSKVTVNTDAHGNPLGATIAYYKKATKESIVETFKLDKAAQEAEEGVNRLVLSSRKATAGIADFEKATLQAINRQDQLIAQKNKTVSTLSAVLDPNSNRSLAGTDYEEEANRRIQAIKDEVAKLDQVDSAGERIILPEKDFLAIKRRIAELTQDARDFINQSKNAEYAPTQLESHSVSSGNQYRANQLKAQINEWKRAGIYVGDLKTKAEDLAQSVTNITKHEDLKKYLEGMKEARALAKLATQDKKAEEERQKALNKEYEEYIALIAKRDAIESKMIGLDAVKNRDELAALRADYDAVDNELNDKYGNFLSRKDVQERFTIGELASTDDAARRKMAIKEGQISDKKRLEEEAAAQQKINEKYQEYIRLIQERGRKERELVGLDPKKNKEQINTITARIDEIDESLNKTYGDLLSNKIAQATLTLEDFMKYYDKWQQEIAEKEAKAADKARNKAEKPYLDYGKTTANSTKRKRDNLQGEIDALGITNPEVLAKIDVYNAKVQEVVDLRAKFENDPEAAKDPALVKQFQKAAAEAERTRRGIKAVIDEEQRLIQLSVEQGFDPVALSADQISNLESAMIAQAKATAQGRVEIKGWNADHTKMNYTVTNSKGVVEEMTMALGQGRNRMYQYRTATKETGTLIEQVFKGIKVKAKELLSFVIGGGSVYKVIELLRQGIQYVREIDLALTELKKVTDETEESYDKFLDTAAKTGARLGATISAVTEATATFAKLGYSMEMATEMAEAAIVYKNVGDNIASTEDAADSIISTLKGFKMEASEAMEIVDRFNEVKFLPPYTAMYMIKMAISEKF